MTVYADGPDTEFDEWKKTGGYGMAKEQLAAVEMIMGMIQGKTEGLSKVDFFPQKVEFPFDAVYEQAFERVSPESQGISSGYLAKIVRELGDTASTDMHHLMILRNGKVICECNFAPYRSGIWHITHSLCKSITGMAVGMLVRDGNLSLDENIYKIFEHRMSPLAKMFRPEVTVEHLLTMTSGVQFNEIGAISGNDWLNSFLNAPVSGKPGAAFQYNSMNTYVLSAIVTERTGMTLAEYLEPRLFQPLGITKYLWETCPKGITKGGWGLFLSPEDMAKLGQLYLQRGIWKGQQLVPEGWVEISTGKQVESVEGTFGYGYQVWMENRPGSFEFNGMLGQNVVVYPDLNMVLVTCAGSDELFQNCVMLNIIRKYFPDSYHPGAVLPEDPCSQMILQRLTAEMESGAGKQRFAVRQGGWEKRNGWSKRKASGVPGIHDCMRQLDGRHYELETKSVGLFPLVMQVFHNNMTEGIQSIGFQYKQGEFDLLVLEGEEQQKIRIGFGKAKESWLNIHGESYLIGTLGVFTKDEMGTLVLKLDIAFLEEAVRRKVHFYFREDEVEIKWLETPGKRLIIEGLQSIMAELENSFWFSAIRGKGGIDILRMLMERTIEPVVKGIDTKDEEQKR